MSARSTITRCLVAVVALAGMTSCTTSDSGPSPSGASAAPTAAAPASSGPAASPSASPSPVAIENLGTVPAWGTGLAIANDRYQVMPADTTGHRLKVTKRATGKVLLVHQVTARGFEPTYAGIFRDRLIVVDGDVKAPETFGPNGGVRPPRVTIYNLTTDRSTPITAVPGAPAPSAYAQQAYVDAQGRFLYPAQSKGGFANCIGAVDLNTLRGRTVTCVKKPMAIFWAGSASTGVTWTTLTVKNNKTCRSSEWLDGDTARHMTATSACNSFDNAALNGWQLWSEQGLEEIEPEVPLAASDGSQKVDLGMMRPQTLLVCGSYAYWQFNENNKPDRIMRWKPGAEVQTVYTAETEGTSTYDDVLLFPQGCSDNHLTLTATRLVPKPKVTLLYVDSR